MKINNKFIRTFAIFASLIMLTVIAVPMVAAQNVDDCEIHEFHSEIQYMDEEEKDEAIEELLYDLKDTIASYNELVIEGYPEDAKYYAMNIAKILDALKTFGVKKDVVFDETQEIPITVEVRDDNKVVLTIGQENSPKVLILALAALMGKIAKKELMQWAIGICASPLCKKWTADGPIGLPFCSHPWCPATILNFYRRSRA